MDKYKYNKYKQLAQLYHQNNIFKYKAQKYKIINEQIGGSAEITEQSRHIINKINENKEQLTECMNNVKSKDSIISLHLNNTVKHVRFVLSIIKQINNSDDRKNVMSLYLNFLQKKASGIDANILDSIVTNKDPDN